MKRLWALIVCTSLASAGLVLAQTSAPPAPAPAAPAAPATRQVAPQPADIPAPKIDNKTGQPQKRFMEMHQQFIERAKQGDVELLFVGDSITQGWGGKAGKEVWDARYANRKAANFGIGGDRTQHVLWRMQSGELEGIKPKVAVVMIGTNNSKADPAEKIASGIEKIVQTIRDKTGAKVLLLGIFPRGETPEKAADQRAVIAAVNKQISKLDDGKNIRYLDIADRFLQSDGSISKEIMPDYLHLSPRGYQTWADAIEPLLKEMLAAQ
jgi:lysophospholipase L1-like esterase